jgi:hypothetical protein
MNAPVLRLRRRHADPIGRSFAAQSARGVGSFAMVDGLTHCKWSRPDSVNGVARRPYQTASDKRSTQQLRLMKRSET